MKYYIDDNNNYLGGSDTPLSSNEVGFAPDDARQKWNGVDYDSISLVELDNEKIAQAESELGSAAIRVIIETIVPMIQDGSITTAIPADIIETAKAKRKAEL